MFDDMIRDLFSLSFDFLGITINIGDIGSTITQFANFSTMKTKAIFTIAKTCYDVVLPVGLSLLTLFVMIKFIKEVLEVNKLTWERVVMIGIEFFIYKALIDNSFKFLTTIMNITSNLYKSVTNAITVSNVATGTTIGNAMAEFCSGGMVKQCCLLIVVLILWIGIMGTMIGCVTQVIMVFAKIILGFATAPVPLAMGMNDNGGANTTKTFIMWMCSLGLEYILMMICTKIYSVGMGTVTSDLAGGIKVFFANALLLAMISFCSPLAEKLTGGR